MRCVLLLLSQASRSHNSVLPWKTLEPVGTCPGNAGIGADDWTWAVAENVRQGSDSGGRGTGLAFCAAKVLEVVKSLKCLTLPTVTMDEGRKPTAMPIPASVCPPTHTGPGQLHSVHYVKQRHVDPPAPWEQMHWCPPGHVRATQTPGILLGTAFGQSLPAGAREVVLLVGAALGPQWHP